MNRGRSSDSLDNGDNDIICSSSGSSSPTDFTSDDENIADNMFLVSGRDWRYSDKSRSRVLINSGQLPKVSKFPTAHHCVQLSRDIQSSARTLSGPNEHLLTNQLNYMDSRPVSSPIHASTSYGNAQLRSRIPDLVPNPSPVTLLSEQPFGRRGSSQFRNVNGDRYTYRFNRSQEHRLDNSNSAPDDENGENVGVVMAVEEEEDHADLFGRIDSQIETSASMISASGRLNTIAVRMCSRLVECRNLIEAIEFVEQNRDLIDNLTRVITQEAPAFRNYDMGNYQIDYSVKESFNPNFWLDREPIVTTADGNCQYHAVSLSLTGNEAYTPEVRLATAVAVIDNREWFDSMLKLIDRGTVLDLVHTISRSYSWGDETTLKAIAVAINRRIFLYTCNIGKKDYEMVKSLSKEELLDAFKEKKYRGGTGIHTYADPLIDVPANNYIMLFHKSEHFIAVLPTSQQPTMFEPYNPIVPVFI